MKISIYLLILKVMKKFLLAFALFTGVASFCNTAEAQNINISINTGRQPAWGPAGYDYAGYYYLPDIDCYYDVNAGLFYYFDRGKWISARYLPYAYRNYDLYGLYKVALNVRDPWRYHHIHYKDYSRYRGRRNQIVIRDSRDSRYRDSRNNNGHKHDSGRPNSNYRPENNYDNNRENGYKRAGYNSRDDRSNRKENVATVRPATSRDNKRNSKAVQSSSGKSDLRMALNTGSERNSRK
jgi:hypothetical protein